MKNNIIKSISFILILFILVEILNFTFIPGSNIFEYGSLKVSAYDILTEKKDTIEVVGLGDSLVYSSLSPMEIWNEYGYTVYDCAQAAQIIANTYEYLKAAVDSQHPKIVLMEPGVIFRNAKKQNIKNKISDELKKLFPLAKYHDNWKKYLSDGCKDNWLDVYKGYKYITNVKSGKNSNDYMKHSDKKVEIPKENLEYFEKIVELCKDNDIKLVIVSFPSQKSWNYKRHNTISELAQENDIEFVDLNLVDLEINWEKDTKDDGNHLNYYGAKKVSKYIGNYLKETELVSDHRDDIDYKDWHKAYKIYVNNLINN